jgi:replicative DNA helicase
MGYPDKSFAIALDEAVKSANEACKRRSAGTIAGLSTTFPTLDKLTGGLHGPKMVVLGGRPGTYKSAIAWQILLRAAKRGLPVGMISLEMGAAELGVRALASELKFSGHAFASGDRQTLADYHTKMRPELRDWPIRIDDHSTYLSEIVSRIIEWKFRFDIQIACIDHLQLIHHQKAANRFQELSEVSRQMKLLAMRLGIPIVLLSQLSREVERDNREPRLSDLRECGNIEQDADIVIFTRCIPGQGQGEDEYELILAKQRQGAARRVISLAINGEHYFVGERA